VVFVAVGLWYRVSVAPPNKLKSVRPYPKTARIVPINVSKWNTLKGGIDAITKLIESYRERIESREIALLHVSVSSVFRCCIPQIQWNTLCGKGFR